MTPFQGIAGSRKHAKRTLQVMIIGQQPPGPPVATGHSRKVQPQQWLGCREHDVLLFGMCRSTLQPNHIDQTRARL